MSFLKKKRFWTDVVVMGSTGGFVIHLDGRVVKTPAKHDLNVPTRAAAELIAVEWDAVEDTLDPSKMPATQWANVAIDRVGEKHADVVEMLAAYGGTDLLCYRATHPDALIERQAAVWDGPLEWAKQRFNAPLLTTQGVIPVDQPNQSVANLRADVAKMEPFSLSAFHDLVHISGSLVLALAIFHGEMSADSAWDAAQVDEIWQNDVWGEDEDAAATAALKRESFLFAAKLLESVAEPNE
jgi:chaperone required for assembly of F1-ATPase